MLEIAPNLWVIRHPLSVLGTNHGRTTTVMRLTSGKLVVHSMAPFTPQDLAEIQAAGEPAWLVEAMLLHDTYAAKGKEHFPTLPFLGPPGFSEVVKFPVLPLLPPPGEWTGEIEVLRVQGAPKLEEHAFLQIATRTLIVADLVFNFSEEETGWDRFFHRHVAGLKRYPGMSRIFKWCVSDREAFRQSIGEILELDFDRIIPGHGEIIETGGKEELRRAMKDAGFA